ncbi:hypothetical protein [Pontimonas sp.]|uniref:hypothetical protein n=1 Tax=Pontimonas sp. TaxID=2304492 RepID=UPI00286FBFF9|nr:hypothetical protein [Pontimonas sp.]MDR9396431.1 hypothetical protein [Pontimonas sp.]
MKRVCWSGWASALLLVVFVVMVAGCQSGPALVPPGVQSAVNADDRERNYDLAWQDIRRMNGHVEREEWAKLPELSLTIVSRMDRLATGEAGPLADRHTARLLEEVREDVSEHTAEENVRVLTAVGLELQEAFDPGEFERARSLAIEAYVVSLALSDAQ